MTDTPAMQKPHLDTAVPPAAGPMHQNIEAKVRAAFAPEHLEVIDESSMHAVPQGAESHFRLLIVSREFDDQSLVQRHQAVYRTLAEEMNGQIHALAMQTLTPAEWNESEQQRATSPECLGGSKD